MTHSSILTTKEIEQQAVNIVSDFLQQFSPPARPKVSYSFIREPESGDHQLHTHNEQSVQVEQRDGKIHLSVHTDYLLGIPVSALQGWLELKVALAMAESDSNYYKFNFQDQILPLMQIAGGAVYFIRELIEHLSRALKIYEATKTINNMSRGLPQVYYHFYTYNPTTEAKELYKKLLPHNWSRASHLCRKLGSYLALSYLAENDVGFSSTLLNDWHKEYGLTENDRAFMEEMVHIAAHNRDREFSFRMVEMFKSLKESLLVGSRENRAAYNSELTI